jgi:hypothetical protein
MLPGSQFIGYTLQFIDKPCTDFVFKMAQVTALCCWKRAFLVSDEQMIVQLIDHVSIRINYFTVSLYGSFGLLTAHCWLGSVYIWQRYTDHVERISINSFHLILILGQIICRHPSTGVLWAGSDSRGLSCRPTLTAVLLFGILSIVFVLTLPGRRWTSSCLPITKR